MSEDQRACTKCGEIKPLTEYAKNGARLHTRCKQCARDAEKARRLADPEAAKARDKAQHAKHRAARLERMRQYSAENAEHRCAVERARYLAEADKIKARNAEWRRNNAAIIRVWNNARRAGERRATPMWADPIEMAGIYAQAAEMTAQSGEPYHVDHIIPLRGKNVCGLHVQNNLRVIPASENLRKGRKFENA